jgi:hypothetical protein
MSVILSPQGEGSALLSFIEKMAPMRIGLVSAT